jgi:FMN phosphatase YigB (HAD superfamily)
MGAEYAGIAGRFAAILCADQVQALKPRRQAYEARKRVVAFLKERLV